VRRPYAIIEAPEFTGVQDDYFVSDSSYADFQAFLASNPEAGAVMPGAAPLRKVRWGAPGRGKGKRGGLRIIYLHLHDIQVLYLLDVYGKDEADDLSPELKRQLRGLARELADELRRSRREGRI
jgi:hypothetical protein